MPPTSSRFWAFVPALILASSTSLAVPPGFDRQQLVAGLDEPTTLAATPDGRFFIGQRNGLIRVWQAGALLPVTLISIPVNTLNGERGLVGLELDPNFSGNGNFYAYFTTPEPRNRVSRFTVLGNVAAPLSEMVLWQNPELAADYHHGGAIRFGADGRIYITTGDQFDSGTSQDLSRQHGKLLRINADGSIPPNNPFVGVAGAAAEIFAFGLRNPFRMSFDPVSGSLYLGDVGGNGTSSLEEIDVAISGANYGWPIQEGPYCYVSDCTGVTYPIYSYAHDDPTYYVGSNQGCIVMGPRYRGTQFPSEYYGNLFIGDYANRWIRRVVLSASGAVTSDPIFDLAPGSGTIADLIEGPDGALYYVTVGVPWSGAPDVGGLWRIRYIGSGNQPPIVAASATPQAGSPPLAVSFSSAGTIDPDGGPSALSYSWDFGDGATSTLASPLHTYTASGMYAATLTASDGAASTVSAPIAITVGAPPVATITAPTPGTLYGAGDSIAFAGFAVDAEDGLLAASALSWSIVLVHESHVHPFFGPLSGAASGSFTIPSVGHPPEHTYFEIRLSATDSDGLVHMASRAVNPQIVDETIIDTVPSGIPVFLDGQAEVTPRTYESIAGYQHEIAAQSSYEVLGVPHLWASWSDGGAATHSFVMPAQSLSLSAAYVPASASPQYRRTDCNTDGNLNIADPISMLSHLFGAGGALACLDACDANDDGMTDLGDAITMLSVLFSGAPAPAPYPSCGTDPTMDGIGCAGYGPCI